MHVFAKAGFYPLIEPFDLKGVGSVAFRYKDSSRQDDTWLYVPTIRRVRRMSSAQRSDALFGQDIDMDSFGGYAGQILSRLAFHGIAASFGLTGAWLTANPDPAVRIAAAGYQMINHTLNHPSYTGASTPGAG